MHKKLDIAKFCEEKMYFLVCYDQVKGSSHKNRLGSGKKKLKSLKANKKIKLKPRLGRLKAK